MDVLVINCGSSSLKYRLLDMTDNAVIASGVIDRIGETGSHVQHRWMPASGPMQAMERKQPVADHRAAFSMFHALMRETGTEDRLKSLGAIGHRVVHGGEAFESPALIDTHTIDAIRRLAPLAPLHNADNLLGIELCQELFPSLPQVAVFDTAFHRSMPAEAYRYAIPDELYTKNHVRRYGFHGTSHAYVARRAARYLSRPLEELNLITLHLGNGCSATAIRGGRSVDTSMGMTPLEGLVMGTRSGDIDPAIVLYLERETGRNAADIDALLNHESGLKGLCGVNDMREVIAQTARGNASAELALSVFCYRIRKYIGAYIAVLGQVDALVFTAGIGENSPEIRARVCNGLQGLGIEIDAGRNAAATDEISDIQTPGAAIKVLVVRTDEELEIAEQTLEALSST